MKNIGKNADLEAVTAQNTHFEPLATKRRKPPKYLIAQEKHALFSAITNLRDQAIFRLAFHHGLRASELGMIQMTDYHPGRRAAEDRMNIERQKGSIGGETLLVPAAAHAIRQYVKKRGYAPGPLFLSRKKMPISRRQLDRLMKHYCNVVGIAREKAHFHTLKHTCATTLLSERKESIVDVQHHLGHADIRSTMIYAKLTEQANEERGQRLKDWK